MKKDQPSLDKSPPPSPAKRNSTVKNQKQKQKQTIKASDHHDTSHSSAYKEEDGLVVQEPAAVASRPRTMKSPPSSSSSSSPKKLQNELNLKWHKTSPEDNKKSSSGSSSPSTAANTNNTKSPRTSRKQSQKEGSRKTTTRQQGAPPPPPGAYNVVVSVPPAIPDLIPNDNNNTNAVAASFLPGSKVSGLRGHHKDQKASSSSNRMTVTTSTSTINPTSNNSNSNGNNNNNNKNVMSHSTSQLVQDGRRHHKLRKEEEEQQKEEELRATTTTTTTSTTKVPASHSSAKANQKNDPDIIIPPNAAGGQARSTEGTTDGRANMTTTFAATSSSHNGDNDDEQEGMELEFHNNNNNRENVVSARLVEDDDLEQGGRQQERTEQIYREAQQQAREELLKNVLVADEVVDETAKEQRKCRRTMCGALCLMVVVATLSGVLGSAQPWRNDHKDNSQVTIIPVNDLCTGAIAISPLEFAGSGGGGGGSGDAAVQFGSTEGASTVDFDSCTSSVTSGGLGVWYEVVGTGRPIRVSTCDDNNSRTDNGANQTSSSSLSSVYDTQITLFQGSCDSHVCVAGNDNGNAYDDDSCGVSSSLTWPSELGVIYKLCVHGKFVATDGGGSSSQGEHDTAVLQGVPESGDFTLTVDEMVENDFCEGSIAIEPNGVPISGSTLEASTDSQLLTCHGTESSAPGVWYSVAGTGIPMEASVPLESVNTESSNGINVQLTIYKGSQELQNDKREDCAQLQCIAGHDNPFDFASSVVFATNPDVTYFILVHGVDGQRGTFQLEVRETIQNDICETALMIEDVANVTPTNTNNGGGRLQVVQGSTTLATLDDRARNGGFCGNAYNTGASVWYTTIGNGGTIRASTCRQADDGNAEDPLTDTTLAVFQGKDCRNLQCVDGDDDDDSCGQYSTVSWDTVQNATYFILVSGKLEQRGSFLLSVETI